MSFLPETKRTRSIRTTLLLWLLPFATLFMLLAWYLHGALLERMSRDFVRERLQQEVAMIEQQLGTPSGLDALDGNYFGALSHHLFVLRVGAQSRLSHPQWSDLLTPWLDLPDQGLIELHGVPEGEPTSHRYMAWRTETQVNGQPVTIVAAEDYSQLQASAHELHLWTAAVAAGLLVVLFALILLAVQLSMRPVRQLQQDLKALKQGRLQRLGDTVPQEFSGLIGQLNQLLDTLQHRLQKVREANANLSHRIKTPIAAINQLISSDQPITPEARSQISQRLDDISRQLDGSLHASHSGGPLTGSSCQPLEQARELLWMLGRLHSHIEFELDSSLADAARWPVEEQDFSELLGNLADNAGKWARSRVRVGLSDDGKQRLLVVEDDGPGVPAEEREQLGTRGWRLDQQMPGHGLGLAIVRDLAARYEGQVQFGVSTLGGLLVRVDIPTQA
ncbi:ATP-binding protein [Halopseudomonas sp.]|uniref:ATP-binding protein n=1 Tax=Halopseudomonas sp. TaxID=2901191 RepID=UPI00311F8565